MFNLMFLHVWIVFVTLNNLETNILFFIDYGSVIIVIDKVKDSFNELVFIFFNVLYVAVQITAVLFTESLGISLGRPFFLEIILKIYTHFI